MTRVYVSATTPDLQDCRHQISQLLRRIGYQDISLPYYRPEHERPVRECLDEIAHCDLYIGLFAWRYGWVPTSENPEHMSLIEMEYRTAIRQDRPCLIFLLHGKALWPPDFIDDNKERIKNLRAELKEQHSPMYFHSKEDIAAVVAAGIISWAKQRGDSIPNSLSGETDLHTSGSKTQRYRRLSSLFEHFPDDPQSLPLLKSRAAEDADDWVRHDALSALVEYFAEDEETLSILQHCAIEDESDWVRRDAISLLADQFADDPATFSLLCRRTVEDPHKDVRSALVYILVQHFRNSSETLPLLCDRAVEDADEWVRRNAVCALAEHFHSSKEAFAILHDRATDDPRKDVRSAAVYALVRYFRHDAKTFSVLCDRAVNDKSPRPDSRRVPFASVREIAVNALARFWPAHPQTVSLLQDRAKNDPTKWLRQKAKALLKEIGHRG